METELKHKTLIELQKIPSIGKACALDLWNIGIRKQSDLKDKNPLELYLRLNEITGQTHDICMLYTFRCAFYFASEKPHEAQKLNLWYWKYKKYNE